jgi:hypothetical protein
MTLRDELDTPGRQLCLVGAFLQTLDKPLATELIELLEDTNIQHTSIHGLFTKKNWPRMAVTTIARHRKKECSCH